jgi:hypothetical protein
VQKIPTLFKRDPENMRHVLPEFTPGCEWVLAGEGVATRKYDGTCCRLDPEGNWWARREVKPGKQAPENFQPVEHDEITGKTVGWEPMAQSAFAKWHEEVIERQAQANRYFIGLDAGTFELCGPKVNGNPEGFDQHVLIRHADAARLDLTPPEPSDTEHEFKILGQWLLDMPYEGIVWHHPDGRMAKLKRRDFS